MQHTVDTDKHRPLFVFAFIVVQLCGLSFALHTRGFEMPRTILDCVSTQNEVFNFKLHCIRMILHVLFANKHVKCVKQIDTNGH